jgi:hypothetical protein
VIVSWIVPSSNGSPISAYRVKLQQKDGSTLTEELANCNGSNAAIVAAASCSIPLSVLQASPYLLTLGDSVYATVSATNLYGESSSSAVGNGATIVTVPDAPINLADNT